MRSLEYLSFYDQLTALKNRHAFKNFLEELKPGEKIAVVYCDVTGLKVLNDTKGHDAGDRLICDAAKCIKDAFFDYEKFRICGDEFLVICKDINDEDLIYLVNNMKACLKRRKVLMAVGYSIIEFQKDYILADILHTAEMRMYEEKKYHYTQHAAERRKNNLS